MRGNDGGAKDLGVSFLCVDRESHEASFVVLSEGSLVGSGSCRWRRRQDYMCRSVWSECRGVCCDRVF
jgi:hypothetical protein